MTAPAALGLAYGVVGIVLMAYVMRLWHQVQRTDPASRRADTTPRAIPDR